MAGSSPSASWPWYSRGWWSCVPATGHAETRVPRLAATDSRPGAAGQRISPLPRSHRRTSRGGVARSAQARQQGRIRCLWPATLLRGAGMRRGIRRTTRWPAQLQCATLDDLRVTDGSPRDERPGRERRHTLTDSHPHGASCACIVRQAVRRARPVARPQGTIDAGHTAQHPGLACSWPSLGAGSARLPSVRDAILRPHRQVQAKRAKPGMETDTDKRR